MHHACTPAGKLISRDSYKYRDADTYASPAAALQHEKDSGKKIQEKPCSEIHLRESLEILKTTTAGSSRVCSKRTPAQPSTKKLLQPHHTKKEKGPPDLFSLEVRRCRAVGALKTEAEGLCAEKKVRKRQRSSSTSGSFADRARHETLRAGDP